LPRLDTATTSTKFSFPCDASAPPRGTTISLEMGSPALSPAIVMKMAIRPHEVTKPISCWVIEVEPA
jgi:hypothetical protein